MSEQPEAPPPGRPDQQPPAADASAGWAAAVQSCRWPAALVALALIGFAVYSRFLSTGEHAARGAVDTARRVISGAGEIARNLRSGNITTSFTAAIPQLTPASNLELATSTVTEVFDRRDEKRILWDYVSLGTTVSEIKAPVTYRYHLPLREPWRLEVEGRTCIVQAPAIRPSLPPAIHTDRMEKNTERGWLRFNADEQMTELEKSLTPILGTYAGNAAHIEAVREQCRVRVAEFVRGWLLREDHWREDRFSAIKVVFADEAGEGVRYSEAVLQIDRGPGIRADGGRDGRSE